LVDLDDGAVFAEGLAEGEIAVEDDMTRTALVTITISIGINGEADPGRVVLVTEVHGDKGESSLNILGKVHIVGGEVITRAVIHIVRAWGLGALGSAGQEDRAVVVSRRAIFHLGLVHNTDWGSAGRSHDCDLGKVLAELYQNAVEVGIELEDGLVEGEGRRLDSEGEIDFIEVRWALLVDTEKLA
jgi:hypothetical protein